MEKVLWNNEMDLCVGLSTELDHNEFVIELERTHQELTGDALRYNEGAITLMNNLIWKFELEKGKKSCDCLNQIKERAIKNFCEENPGYADKIASYGFSENQTKTLESMNRIYLTFYIELEPNTCKENRKTIKFINYHCPFCGEQV